jgi:hypothetical protein
MIAEDYLALIKSLIALCPAVKSFSILREEAQGNKGFMLSPFQQVLLEN